MLIFLKFIIRFNSTILNNFYEKKNRNEKNEINNFNIKL